MPSVLAPQIGLALIYDHRSSFIARDSEILSKHYWLREVLYSRRADLPRLARAVVGTSLNISWFALGYAYSAGILSRALGRPNIIIAGGWDVTYEPTIGYGAMGDPRRVGLTTKALAGASMIIAVSEATKLEVLRWVDREVQVVPHGVDARHFSPGEGPREGVATVANISNAVQYRVKGIDVLLDVARVLPEVSFRLVGRIAPDVLAEMKLRLPRNIELIGWLDEGHLIELLQRTRVYLQPSYRESFGVSLLEAMSCDCRPVVSNRKALPEVVGDAGFVCPYGDVRATAEAVRRALSANGHQPRQRVLEHFTIERREKRLIELLAGLIVP